MLEYSSLLFIIPTLFSWYKNNIDYGNAFLFLTYTSYNYHIKSNYKIKNWKFWIDQFAIFNVVLIGTYNYILYCKTCSKIIVFICFISCIILYLYNKNLLSNRIHLIIHILGIIGHNIIIYNLL